MVNQEEQIEDKDGQQALNPKASATTWGCFGVKSVLERARKGELLRRKGGEPFDAGSDKGRSVRLVCH